MWISRDYSKKLKQISQNRPIIVLTGCRQSGKTSLLKETFPKANYVTLDLPSQAAEAEESGETFLEKFPSPVIIDEVQYAPQLFRYLKKLVDEQRQKNGQFLLTGSQKFQLMHKVSESLAGRAAILELHTLSGLEYERAFNVTLQGDALWDFIWRGGYPEIHASGLDSEQYYSDYLATYLTRDVQQILQVRSLRDFERMLRLLAIRNGQLLSMNTLATEVGVTVNTIKSWIGVLESSNILTLLEPYYQNLGKRIVKTPKIYFLDTGLASFLAGFRRPEDLRKSSLNGAFFETFVLGQLVRYWSGRGVQAPLYFYRDHYGHEIDFVVPVGEAFHLIECKLSEGIPKTIPGFAEVEKLVGEARILSRNVVTPRRENVALKEMRLINGIDWSRRF